MGWWTSCTSLRKSITVNCSWWANRRAALVVGHQPQARRQVLQDVRGLGDHPLAVFQERRRERQPARPVALQELLQRRHAAALGRRQAGDIAVAGTGVLQRQAHELAAPLDRRPVIEVVFRRRHLHAVRPARRRHNQNRDVTSAADPAVHRLLDDVAGAAEAVPHRVTARPRSGAGGRCGSRRRNRGRSLAHRGGLPAVPGSVEAAMSCMGMRPPASRRRCAPSADHAVVGERDALELRALPGIGLAVQVTGTLTALLSRPWSSRSTNDQSTTCRGRSSARRTRSCVRLRHARRRQPYPLTRAARVQR